jgi:hypothetical protein
MKKGDSPVLMVGIRIFPFDRLQALAGCYTAHSSPLQAHKRPLNALRHIAMSEPCPTKPGLNDEQLEALQASPKKVVGDEGSVEERSITEQITLDKYRSTAGCATAKPPFGMYVGVVRPKGTV